MVVSSNKSSNLGPGLELYAVGSIGEGLTGEKH